MGSLYFNRLPSDYHLSDMAYEWAIYMSEPIHVNGPYVLE